MKFRLLVFIVLSLLVPTVFCVAQYDNVYAESIYAEFSPDGNLMLTNDTKSLTCRLFDAKSGKFIRELETGFVKPVQNNQNVPGGRIYIADFNLSRFSPDGKSILLGYQGQLVNWNIQSQKIAYTKPAYFQDVSPDGRVVVANEKTTTRFYNTETGKEIRKLKTNGYPRFSPDGNYLIVKSNEVESLDKIRFVNATSGNLIKEFIRDKQYLSSQGISPDGRLFLCNEINNVGESGNLLFWEVASGNLIDSIAGNYITRFSSDSKKLLTLEQDPSNSYLSYGTAVSVWDVSTRKLIFKLEGHEQTITKAYFTPDGKRIVTSSEDGTAIIWDATNGNQLNRLEGHMDKVYVFGFDKNSKYVLTGAEDQIVKMWELETGNLIYTFNGEMTEQ